METDKHEKKHTIRNVDMTGVLRGNWNQLLGINSRKVSLHFKIQNNVGFCLWNILGA